MDWLDEAIAQRDAAIRVIAAATANLTTAQQKLTDELRVRTHIGGPVGEAKKLPERDHNAVVAAVRAGRFDALSGGELRYAARLLRELAVAHLDRLLEARPRLARVSFREFFKSFEAFAELAERPQLALLLARFPESSPDQNATLPIEELLGSRAPDSLARAFRGEGLENLARWLGERGFPLGWSFTAHVIAHWLDLRVAAGATVDREFEQLERSPELVSRLLGSTPRDVGRPVTVEWPRVQARVAATFLRAGLIRTQLSDANVGRLTDRLVESPFKDPTLPPLTARAEILQKLDGKSFDAFVEALVTDDITLFFQYAMQNEARKRFWLKYTKGIRRTRCVINRQTYGQLGVALAGADARRAGALRRVSKYATNEPAQAFCLVFKDIVAVEFSRIGHAAYFYRREDFEARLEPMVTAKPCQFTKAGDLKKPYKITKLDHIPDPGWEHKFDSFLRTHGVRANE